ncbi:hypothetical protein E2C01_006235 [Portunus trituberculatus]|uniref:Uncharacterized protein n=1 Tax=Portunus trituberculatus TaxID=210409 RepID=A0A5B7CUK1_PORTR|nr:hypothetical protein [Portunus trituberculatus]
MTSRGITSVLIAGRVCIGPTRAMGFKVRYQHRIHELQDVVITSFGERDLDGSELMKRNTVWTVVEEEDEEEEEEDRLKE